MNKLALTEKRNPETVNIDLMDSWQIAKTLNNEDKKVALAVEKALPQIGDAIEVIAEAFRKGGRLAYFGAGTAGVWECLMRQSAGRLSASSMVWSTVLSQAETGPCVFRLKIPKTMPIWHLQI